MLKLLRHGFTALIVAAILWTPELASARIHPVDSARRIARHARDHALNTAHRVTHHRHHRHHHHHKK